MSASDQDTIINRQLIHKIARVTDFLSAYHQHQVIGLEALPNEGALLFASNHSFATYDILLLEHKIFRDRSRVTRSLMDRWFFKCKPVGDFFERLGALEGSPFNAKKALLNGDWLTVAPGGMKEALRPSNQKYKFCWGRHKGFVKLSIQTQTPIVLTACPRADDIFDIFDSEVSKYFFETFRLPFVFLKGWGLSPLPKPVKLTHLLSEPIPPPPLDADHFEEQVDKHHAYLIARMESLMAEALGSN